MGTWAVDAFGNDFAQDWAEDLHETSNMDAIENTLDTALAGEGELEAPLAAEGANVLLGHLEVDGVLAARLADGGANLAQRQRIRFSQRDDGGGLALRAVVIWRSSSFWACWASAGKPVHRVAASARVSWAMGSSDAARCW